MNTMGWILLMGLGLFLPLNTLTAQTAASGDDLAGMIEAVSQSTPCPPTPLPKPVRSIPRKIPTGRPSLEILKTLMYGAWEMAFICWTT
jgi:hypothetical protein